MGKVILSTEEVMKQSHGQIDSKLRFLRQKRLGENIIPNTNKLLNQNSQNLVKFYFDFRNSEYHIFKFPNWKFTFFYFCTSFFLDFLLCFCSLPSRFWTSESKILTFRWLFSYASAVNFPMYFGIGNH